MSIAYIRYETQSNLQAIAFDPEKLKTVGEVNKIASGSKQISFPALSPNGEEYVVRYHTQTQEDIAIFNRDGSNWRNLTNDKFRDRTPRWSPDGKKIAFTSDRSGKYQIWMINADGSNLRQITFSEKTGTTAPNFSPDGLRLIYSEIDNKSQSPFILDLKISWQEQTPVPLSSPPNFEGSYSVWDWSADGSKLLMPFFDSAAGGNGIYLFDFKTSAYEKMLESGGYPIWLNDNRHFLYLKGNTIFVEDTQTKKTTEIYTPASYGIQHPNISPDNRLIYFRYLQVDTDVWLMDASQN
ncbi:MAG: hypothetical protein ACR2MD_05090 [Aridibacter sp.]